MNTTDTLPCFKLKGSHYTLTSLQLQDIELDDLDEQLSDKVKQAPNFFDNTPIVIDLQIIADKVGPLDLEKVCNSLKSFKMIPIGVRGGREEQQTYAKSLGLAVLPETKKENTKQDSPKPKFNHAKIIEHPIRSGQQVYAQGGDLIIIGSVSAGAECLADGNIHIYGALRGRALAGILGDTKARIFCQNLEAELVSIAGQYRVSEHLKEGIWQNAASIHLKDGHLNITAL